MTNITINFNTSSIVVNGETLDLSYTEFKILSHLALNKDRVCSREELLRECWKNTIVDHRNIDTHIVRLRKKIGDKTAILTFHGKGYKINVHSVDIISHNIDLVNKIKIERAFKLGWQEGFRYGYDVDEDNHNDNDNRKKAEFDWAKLQSNLL